MYTSEDLEKLLQEKCTSKFRKAFVNFKGYTFGEDFEKCYHRIYDCPVYDDDVWVGAYPKNGTTWTQEMVWLIRNNLDYEGAKTYLSSRYPFFEFSVDVDYRQVKLENPDFEMPLALYDSVKFFQEFKRPRFVKTHLPFDLLPRMIQERVQKPKIIFVVRNPKDTCISYYHHCIWLHNYRVTFEEFCELFLAGKVGWGSYWKTVLSYKKQEKTSNILIIKFEDMKSNLNEVIRQVSRFLEREMDEEQIEILANHLSFENMKKNPAVNYENVKNIPLELRETDREGVFMRCGETNQYKTEMSAEMIQRFNKKTKLAFKDFLELIY